MKEENDMMGEDSANAQVVATGQPTVIGECVKCVEPVEKHEEGSLTKNLNR